MLGRLFLGIVKGIVLGGLLGFGLVKLGWAVPVAVVAYLAAALVGVLIGLIAGKPIWAKDAKIEAGMKAGVGALLGLGLMFAARKWLTFPVPDALLGVVGAKLEGAAPAVGAFGMTALAAVAAVLGGFYDADNTPGEEKPEAKSAKPAPTKARNVDASHPSAVPRVADAEAEEEADDDIAEEPQKKEKK